MWTRPVQPGMFSVVSSLEFEKVRRINNNRFEFAGVMRGHHSFSIYKKKSICMRRTLCHHYVARIRKQHTRLRKMGSAGFERPWKCHTRYTLIIWFYQLCISRCNWTVWSTCLKAPFFAWSFHILYSLSLFARRSIFRLMEMRLWKSVSDLYVQYVTLPTGIRMLVTSSRSNSVSWSVWWNLYYLARNSIMRV